MFANPKKDWEEFGKNDPFFGVFSQEQFKEKTLDDAVIERFYLSGERHVERVLAIAKRHFSFEPVGKALDFGCGTGRLTLPLARTFDEALGLDISEGMLATAREAAKQRGVNNIAFERVTDGYQFPKASFHLVHTFITLQHMTTAEGERRIRDLAAALADGGVGAIHFTYGHARGSVLYALRELLKRNALTRAFANVLKRRKWNHPVMLMSKYSVPNVLNILGESGIEKIYMHRVDDWGNYGAFLFFEKGSGAASEFSNPMTPAAQT